ncbi:DUF1254 domain-containing protein [Flavobacterium sp. SORGH_AS_0622]|uniref:DUF1254 domain-containing protein n=1 Tax=Flavobacterium sp. SORGH_AS_0622 TaxID=3041772 RepID=UPI00278255C9|nr:DUF1254 domain-containing protein [Flavobacterium sp. SORGH_AS_0622]MDQ1166464.1 hypothetical protein [Flavobacterium sp. SORGH_AS_0622]
MMTNRKLVSFSLILLIFISLSCKKEASKENTESNNSVSDNSKELSLEEVRSITKEAYIYGFPLVDNTRIQYAYFVDKQNPEFKAPWNTIRNISRVFTSEDRALQTPNSDTPYSWIGLDLRSEPIVFVIPPIEKNRYWSLQLIDMYTHNFAYLGSRATGNSGGAFMLAGPDWNGDTPKGITKVIKCETQIALGIIRTQLFDPGDLKNVKALQEKYSVKTLSAYLGKPAPTKAKPIDFIKPLTQDEQKNSLEFFNNLNFALQFCPVHPSEKDLRARFAKIGIQEGKVFNPESLSPDVKNAMNEGIKDAWLEMDVLKKKLITGEVFSGDGFGTREFLKNNYLFRMSGAFLGIYGNSKEEAIYPTYYVDAKGEKLDGKNQYILRFPKGQLPPVNSFWSLTMYDQPASLLVANPINRYLLNSPMMPQFKKDPDGGLTFYIQAVSPGKEKESNWLPAPKGPFALIMRLYWPKQAAIDGTWKQPPLNKV